MAISHIEINFYPRSPRGERPCHKRRDRIQQNFYPRSPRGERLIGADLLQKGFVISTHAPREGSDHVHQIFAVTDGISTHAPREGSDSLVLDFLPEVIISTHAPREGSDWAPTAYPQGWEISTHAPREGSDYIPDFQAAKAVIFLPTLPARGATKVRTCREGEPR